MRSPWRAQRRSRRRAVVGPGVDKRARPQMQARRPGHEGEGAHMGRRARPDQARHRQVAPLPMGRGHRHRPHRRRVPAWGCRRGAGPLRDGRDGGGGRDDPAALPQAQRRGARARDRHRAHVRHEEPGAGEAPQSLLHPRHPCLSLHTTRSPAISSRVAAPRALTSVSARRPACDGLADSRWVAVASSGPDSARSASLLSCLPFPRRRRSQGAPALPRGYD